MNSKGPNYDLEEIRKEHMHENCPSPGAIKLMTSLAEKNYLPAMNFFIECLDDYRDAWRSLGLDLLFANYDCEGNVDVIEKVQKLLLNDDNFNIRSKAAAFLGGISKWPDTALRNSLVSDTEPTVLAAAFESILLLGGVPYDIVSQEVNRLNAGLIKPTFEEIERISQEYADSL